MVHGVVHGPGPSGRCFVYVRTQKTVEVSHSSSSSYFDLLERFSFECRKVISFALTMPHDWFKKFAPLFHPIRSKTRANRDPLARVFPRFASATCTSSLDWFTVLGVFFVFFVIG